MKSGIFQKDFDILGITIKKYTFIIFILIRNFRIRLIILISLCQIILVKRFLSRFWCLRFTLILKNRLFLSIFIGRILMFIKVMTFNVIFFCFMHFFTFSLIIFSPLMVSFVIIFVIVPIFAIISCSSFWDSGYLWVQSLYY